MTKILIISNEYYSLQLQNGINHILNYMINILPRPVMLSSLSNSPSESKISDSSDKISPIRGDF